MGVVFYFFSLKVRNANKFLTKKKKGKGKFISDSICKMKSDTHTMGMTITKIFALTMR